MNKLALVCVTILLLISHIAQANENIPAWENYPAEQSKISSYTAIDINKLGPDSNWILESLDPKEIQTPNFAGKFRLVMLSAGTMAMAVVVINCETGEVFKAPFTVELGCDFRLNSSLLIENPNQYIKEAFPNSPIPPWIETNFYKWTGEAFTKIKRGCQSK